MSTPQELKAITRRFLYEAWGKADLKVLDEICDPNYKMSEQFTLSDLKQFITVSHQAIPDLEVKFVGDLIADENSVAYRFEMRGTHLGEYQGQAPTGKPFFSTGITILHFANGKIIRDEYESSSPSFEVQVGLAKTTPV